ncbi:MAG TPA: hypothetical protein VIX41_11470 [Acidimicrobiales bacterium]
MAEPVEKPPELEEEGFDPTVHPITFQAGRDWVAVVLAIGLAVAINLLTAAIMYDAVRNEAEISENATQVLVAAFGGIVGVLGGYIGGRTVERAAQREREQAQQANQTPPPPVPPP